MSDERCYGVIIECKDEQPLIMEGAPMTYDIAHERMKYFTTRQNVIRVAMFKAVHVNGNETLLPKEQPSE